MSDTLERFLAGRIAEGWMPGAAWWVEQAGRILSRGSLGRASTTPDDARLLESTPFDLASLTKPLATATLLVLAEQDGLVDLARPVADYSSALQGTELGEQTLLSLATHRSGLPAWLPPRVDTTTPHDYLANVAREPLAAARPTLYSDPGYMVLGALLEQVHGEPLAAVFRHRIARPLGLRRTAFATDARRFEDAAATENGNFFERSMAGDRGRGYAWRDRVPRGEVHDANAHRLGGAAGHAGLFGPVDEVASMARELLHPHKLGLSDSALARLLLPAPGSDSRTIGFELARASRATRGILPPDAPGHTGFTGTSLWLDPSSDRFFVLLTNRVHPHVISRDFQLLRRGFHRLAARLPSALAAGGEKLQDRRSRRGLD